MICETKHQADLFRRSPSFGLPNHHFCPESRTERYYTFSPDDWNERNELFRKQNHTVNNSEEECSPIVQDCDEQRDAKHSIEHREDSAMVGHCVNVSIAYNSLHWEWNNCLKSIRTFDSSFIQFFKHFPTFWHLSSFVFRHFITLVLKAKRWIYLDLDIT